MNPREFLEALKKKSCSEDDDLIQYCYMFALISMDLVLQRKINLDTQCQWFLQELPEITVMEIFYRHDIDLKDDDGFNFENSLEKAMVLVKRKKYLADFILGKGTDLVDNYTDSQGKVYTSPNIVELFTNQTPPTRF